MRIFSFMRSTRTPLVTNPRRVTKPRNAADAIVAIVGLLSFLHVLPIPARAVEGWLDLLRRHPVTGGDVFDLQLAATMLANGVQRIYTFNTTCAEHSRLPQPRFSPREHGGLT